MSARQEHARHVKASARMLKALRGLLVAHRRRYAPTSFYWRNGILRERWLRPTKGWCDRRHDAMPIEGLTGYWDVETIDAELKRLAKWAW